MPINWTELIAQGVVGLFQAIISGLFVGFVVYRLDERRVKRERQLSDYHIASNWKSVEPRVSLRDFDLSKRNLSGCKFTKANLENVILFEAKMWGTNFEGANLRHADFRKSKLVGSKLAKAIAVSADFSKATITKNLTPENKFWSDFKNISLKGAKFIGAYMDGVRFANASLRGANFRGAIILNCDFSGADVNDVNWKKAKRIENCIWKDVKFIKLENFPPDLWKEVQRQNAEQ